MQVRGYLLLSIAVFLYSINDLFVSNKGNIKIKDLVHGTIPNFWSKACARS